MSGLKSCFILPLIIFIACESDPMVVPPPANLMEEQLYLDVFTEMEMLKVYQSQKIPFEVIDSLYDEIILKYDIDGEHFVESHRYYQAQVIEHQVRVDTVKARLQRELDRITGIETQRRKDQIESASRDN